MTAMPDKSFYSQAFTMIDVVTGWIEIRTITSVRAEVGSNEVELTWSTYYSLPDKVMVERGNEILAELREMIINEWV